MKRAVRLFLILGALIGLFGQGFAYASVPLPAAAVTVAMSEDCMSTMKQDEQPAGKPCKGITWDCIASMGCISSVTVQDSTPAIASRAIAEGMAFWSTIGVLAGQNPSPEPPPPTPLG